jgi:hypothetical protein
MKNFQSGFDEKNAIKVWLKNSNHDPVENFNQGLIENL